MFRMFRLSKTVHSNLRLLSLSNRYAARYVNFKVDCEEQDLWNTYRSEMAKLRWRCKKDNLAKIAEERKEREEYEKKFTWESRFADAFKYAAEVNEKQKARLEAIAQEKISQREVVMEERREKEESEREYIEIDEKEGLERELEIAKSYITSANIEEVLDDALDNPIVTNFGFPNSKVSGDGKGVKNFDENGEVILHEEIPDI